MRANKLGAIGFMVAVAVIYSQSFIDFIESPEQLTRLALWALAAALYAIVVTLVVNLCLLPASPKRLLTDEADRQLEEVDAQLVARLSGQEAPSMSAGEIEQGSLSLHRHLASAVRGDRDFDREKGWHLMRVAALDRLHAAAFHLSRLPTSVLTREQTTAIIELKEACSAYRGELRKGRTFVWGLFERPSLRGDDSLDIVLLEMRDALRTLAGKNPMSASQSPEKKETLWAEDAFTNPAYARFALKTVSAALIGYFFYTGIQWVGIHTVLITCIIVALPSVGAASHKGATRIAGCVLGSLASLFATVFLVPRVDSIVGLLLISSPVFLAGAWIAAGSPRSNYIGVQFVFSYALALFGSFGPTTDVTEIRDRMFGILLGVGLYVLISLFTWPEREGEQLGRRLAQLLREIAALARVKPRPSFDDASPSLEEHRRRVWDQLRQNRELQARVALEPSSSRTTASLVI
jgi:multidrug resistance protein MdtO